MDCQHEEWMDRLEARCQRLERANVRWRRGSMILMGFLAFGTTLGFRTLDKPQPWEGASLTVVDEEGSKLAWVYNEKGYGRIQLFNQHGKAFWSTPPYREVPPDIRDKIATRTMEEAMKELDANAVAQISGVLDAKTRVRLKEEFKLLLFRLRDLKRNGK